MFWPGNASNLKLPGRVSGTDPVVTAPPLPVTQAVEMAAAEAARAVRKQCLVVAVADGLLLLLHPPRDRRPATLPPDRFSGKSSDRQTFHFRYIKAYKVHP